MTITATTSTPTLTTAPALTENEATALESLRRNREGRQDTGWCTVYLDNAKPAAWTGNQWAAVLGSLERKGLYRVDDGYAWGDVYVPVEEEATTFRAGGEEQLPAAGAVPLTTADLREAARGAEGSLDWSRAADLYRAAVAVYPPQAAKGPLGQRDIANLVAQAQICERTAVREAQAAQ